MRGNVKRPRGLLPSPQIYIYLWKSLLIFLSDLQKGCWLFLFIVHRQTDSTPSTPNNRNEFRNHEWITEVCVVCPVPPWSACFSPSTPPSRVIGTADTSKDRGANPCLSEPLLISGLCVASLGQRWRPFSERSVRGLGIKGLIWAVRDGSLFSFFETRWPCWRD